MRRKRKMMNIYVKRVSEWWKTNHKFIRGALEHIPIKWMIF